MSKARRTQADHQAEWPLYEHKFNIGWVPDTSLAEISKTVLHANTKQQKATD
jgi:hypothetical protein